MRGIYLDLARPMIYTSYAAFSESTSLVSLFLLQNTSNPDVAKREPLTQPYHSIINLRNRSTQQASVFF